MRRRGLMGSVLAVAAVACTAPNPNYDPHWASRVIDPGDGGATDATPAAPDLAGELADLVVSPPELATAPDLAPLIDLRPPPDLVPLCEGWRGGPNNACWYVTPLNTDCNTFCMAHSGFDAVGTQHKGTSVCEHFYTPQQIGNPDNSMYEPIEYCLLPGEASHDANCPGGCFHLGATGKPPTGTERHFDAHNGCACLH